MQERGDAETFLTGAGADLSTFEAVTARLQAADARVQDDAELRALAAASTQIKDAAERYGLTQIARLAGFAERLLPSAPRLTGAEFRTLLGFFEQLAACLRGALGRVAAGDDEGALGLELAQLGGTELLLSLLKGNPQAFARLVAERTAPVQVLQTPHTLSASLHTFYREQREDWTFFAPEIREYLTTIRRLLADIRTSATGLSTEPPTEPQAALFRALHTVKGTAYMVGLEPLGSVAHRLEDLLEGVQSGEPLSAHVGHSLELGVDVLEAMLEAAEGRGERLEEALTRLEHSLASPVNPDDTDPDGINPDATNPEPAPAAVTELITQQTPTALPEGLVRLSLERIEHLTELTDELVGVRARLAQGLEQIAELGPLLTATQRYLRRLAGEFETRPASPVVNARSGIPSNAASAGAPGLASGDVFFSRLEELASDVGEIESQLGALLRVSSAELTGLAQTSRTLRSEVGRARRVRLAVLFNRLEGLLKGRADVRLETRGADTELDAAVLAGLTEPLLHLVRNALAHATEPADVRLAAHKKAALTLSLRAAIQGRTLLLEVEDDGPGVDTAALRHAAVARGLYSAEDAAALSEVQAQALMFVPGLSTASEVDTAAGRGVGLDAARAGVARLSGALDVTTGPGRGSRFQLRVPLSRRVSDALFVRAGGYTFALPLSAVQLLTEASQEALAEARFVVEGEVVPLFGLAQLLGLTVQEHPSGATSSPLTPGFPTVILEAADTRYGLVVEALAQAAEVVVKDAGGLLEGLNYLSGLTVSGTGDVTPLLAPDGLLQLTREAAPSSAQAPALTRAVSRVLVVDDSVSVRRLLSRTLARAGYEVVTAADAQEALAYILTGGVVHAVLTDLEMPHMNGFELIEWLRAHAQTAALPICVMTTRAGTPHLEHAYALGADAYLTKPVTAAQLLNFLTQAQAG